MAVPKRKVSKARRDKRRNSHWKLAIPGVVACPKCGEPRLPHRACKAAPTTAVKLSQLRQSNLRERVRRGCNTLFFSFLFRHKVVAFLPVK